MPDSSQQIPAVVGQPSCIVINLLSTCDNVGQQHNGVWSVTENARTITQSLSKSGSPPVGDKVKVGKDALVGVGQRVGVVRYCQCRLLRRELAVKVTHVLDASLCNTPRHRVAWWLSGTALDLRFTGRRFNSRPIGFQVT